MSIQHIRTIGHDNEVVLLATQYRSSLNRYVNYFIPVIMTIHALLSNETFYFPEVLLTNLTSGSGLEGGVIFLRTLARKNQEYL